MKFGSAFSLLLIMTVQGAHVRSNGVRSETFEEGATPSRKIPGSRNHAGFKNGARTPKGHSRGADPRIVDGNIAPAGWFPYYVDLFGCGGSLIGNGGSQFVITAAHCLDWFTGYPHVDVGGLGHGLVDGSGEWDGELRQVVSYAIHYGYDTSQPNVVQSDDIAILKLDSPVDVEWPLWLSSVSPAKDTAVFVPGHGNTQGGGVQSDDLLYATIYVKDDSECEHYQSFNGDKTICAGGSGMGICQGDSGGPLVMEADGFDWLVGVVSFADTGCTNAQHDGFVEVAAYIDWIEDTIAGM